jgi:uncharacterized membrane protein
MFAPQAVLRALGSTGHYDDTFAQFTGVMILALGIIVAQLIRRRLDGLYPTTLAVRAIIVVWLLYLYSRTSDPLFLAIVAVVGLGMLLTGTCYVLDRRRPS